MVPAKSSTTGEQNDSWSLTKTPAAPDNAELSQPSASSSWTALTKGRSNDLFVDQRWYRVVEETYGFNLQSYRLGDSVLPFCDVDDGRGRRFVSLPFCDFVDVPSEPEDWSKLATPLLETGLPLILDTAAGHPAAADERLVTTQDGVHHVIAVDKPLDELMQGWGTLTRRQVRRSARRGIEFIASTDRTHLEAFHQLHVGVRKYRHGLLAQPMELFDAIDRHFIQAGHGVVIAGLLDGEMVGGCLLLATKGVWHYKFSVSHPDFRSEGVSHGAVAGALRHCLETESQFFDFGRSDLVHEGLVQFKRRFAPNEQQLFRHQSAALPPSAFADTLGELTRLFTLQSVPDEVTAQAGAALYRYFA